MIARYGAAGTFAVPTLASSVRQTMKEAYGEEFPQRTDAVVSKMKETNIQRWGVECPVHSSELSGAIAERNQERWGTAHPIAAPAVREKIRTTMQARYGVESFTETGIPTQRSSTPEATSKRLSTLKDRGLLMHSHVELECLDVLRTVFQHVMHSVVVNGWSIDFYVHDVDVYVQFDGTYWHGLDRPIEEIAGSDSPCDAAIHRKWQRDREQDEWFPSHGKCLVRITEEQWKSAADKAGFIMTRVTR